MRQIRASVLLFSFLYSSSISPASAGLLSALFHRKKSDHCEAQKTNPPYEDSPLKVDSAPARSNYQSGLQSPNAVGATIPNRSYGQGTNLNRQSLKGPALVPSRPEQGVVNPGRRDIRIALGVNLSTFEIAAIDGAQILALGTNSQIASLPPGTRWSGVLVNKIVSLERVISPLFTDPKVVSALQSAQTNGSDLRPVAYYPMATTPITDFQNSQSRVLTLPVASASGYLIKPINPDGLIAYNGKLYRGMLCLKPANAAGTLINVINYLDIEDYLLSVVPSEMPSGWPIEALKAQVVAARSYAYANLDKHGTEGYDLKDNTEDQVYSGVKSEAEATNLAVASTEDIVLKYDGKPICAYFHSASGGHTDEAESVWSKSLPYLKAVMDYDDSSPHFAWSRKYSVDELEAKLAPQTGQLLSLVVVSRSPSQRVGSVLAVGTDNAKVLSGETLRRLLKLPSTNFNVFPALGSYVFCGRGFGHGLGLSQWGAKGLAEQGYNAAQILTYYYKDIVVEQIIYSSSGS